MGHKGIASLELMVVLAALLMFMIVMLQAASYLLQETKIKLEVLDIRAEKEMGGAILEYFKLKAGSAIIGAEKEGMGGPNKRGK